MMALKYVGGQSERGGGVATLSRQTVPNFFGHNSKTNDLCKLTGLWIQVSFKHKTLANTDFLIPISLQPNVIGLRNFKL